MRASAQGIRRFAICLALAAASATHATPGPPRRPATEPPAPLLLITLDTTRADHLGAWGWPHAHTPNLDALAARGVRFARCDSAVPITLPSHATLLTGRYPPRHGVRDNAIFTLDESEQTVAETLAAHGWDTAAVVSATVLARHHGLAQGFGDYDDALGTAPATGRGPAGEAVERRADATTDAALARLQTLDAPYFLWVHYYDPHEPYQAPAAWRAAATGPHPAYDAEIAFMDAEIGRLLAALPPHARVVVVGDHGEMLGDGGERTHGLLLAHGVRRVPLLIAGGRLPAGHVVDCLVRTVDVAPTLLELAGLEPGPGVDGISLLPLARASGRDPTSCAPPRLSYAESFLPFFSYRWYPLRALSDGHELYVHGRRPALYDLAVDPMETHDLATERPQATARWATRLERVLADMGATLETSPGRAQPLSEEERARLASLGYIGGGTSGGPVRGALPDPRDMVEVARTVQEAHDLVDAGLCNQALAKLTAVLRRDPNNVPAYNQSGLCLQSSGRLRSALNAFERAAAINPQSAVPVRNAGNVLVQLGALGKAEATFARALDLDPRSPGVAANLAKLRRAHGDASGAAAALDLAEAAGSTHPGIPLERGMLAAAAGDLPRALAAFEQAVERAPKDPAALENAANAAALLKQPQKALAYYHRLTEITPANPGAWFGLATVLFKQMDDKPAARQALEKALDLEADPARRARLERYLRQLEQ